MIKRFIFTALPCEAKPLISHYALKKVLENHPFTLYANAETVLTVSGLGKIAMAGAVAYTLAKFQAQPSPILINIGIAGHPTASLGTLFAAHKITDSDRNRHFYPQHIVKLSCPTAPLYTVSTPETHYSDESLYEMEASAFYEMAIRFTTSELIQVFKVISDNQQSSLQHINAAIVEAWITVNLPVITEGIQQLDKLAHTLHSEISPYYALTLEKWHFTVNSQLQLKALLQRWETLTNKAYLEILELDLKNSKAVLQWLEHKIAQVPVYL
jgi:adenosylhomocysteine nucleosidase